MDLTWTRVPDVVAALLALAADTLEDVVILDGPVAGQDVADDVLMIGVGNDEDADPYRSTRSQESWDLGGRSKESGLIRCQASTWHGGTDLEALRRRIEGWLGLLEAAFRDDQQLSRTCDLLRFGSARWYHLQRPSGAGVGVNFDVTFEAWL